MTHPSAVDRVFRKPICPRGHQKSVVGVDAKGYCLRCAADHIRDRRSKGDFSKPTKRYCERGHDKFVLGMRFNNYCAECDRVRMNTVKRRERAEAFGVPLYLVGKGADVLRVREIRESLGLSRPALSRLSGVNYQTLASIERGRWRGRPLTRKKIVDAIASVMADQDRRLKNLRRS